MCKQTKKVGGLVVKKIMKMVSRLLSSRGYKLLKFFDALAFSYWDDCPFNSIDQADLKKIYKKFEIAKSNVSSELMDYCYNCVTEIPKEFILELALRTQASKKTSDLNFDHGFLIYALVQKLASKNEKLFLLETGTARGFSSIIMSKAIDDAGSFGTIMTFDILPHDKKMFWNCPSDIQGVVSRRELLIEYSDLTDKIIFQQSNTRVSLERTQVNRINFAFLDGAHALNDVLREGKFVAARQTRGDLILFDDFNETLFPGVVEGVKIICAEFNYKLTVIGGKNDRFYAISEKL